MITPVDVPNLHIWEGMSDEARQRAEEGNRRNVAMVREMEAAGCTVIFGDSSRSPLSVKVRRPGHRQIMKASTSGYPIEAVYDAWRESAGPIARVRFHKDQPDDHLMSTGRIGESGARVLGYKHHVSDPKILLADCADGVQTLVGLEDVYLIVDDGGRPCTLLPRVRVIEAVQS